MCIKVLTFNIHHGRGKDKKLDLQRISNVIRKTDADIIGLNEVDKHFSERSDFIDQALFLAQDLNMEYVYGPAVSIEKPGEKNKRQFGNALFTRFPIVKSQNHPFDFLPRIMEDRALLEVKLRIGEQEVTILVVHLSLTPFLRQKESAFILKKIKDNITPSIVMGDWNMSPVSKTRRKVTQYLKDVWIENNLKNKGGNTFPSDHPIRRLDYIFVSKEFEVIDSEVIRVDKKASDHLPFMTTVKLTSE
ncbi:endonuclease/exonuclease/phosphatase family protein [Priestia endophytica]|uniref:endonuclease/exonuclease/phosphatase family protein n=1 Tax=Priestia endophytica TaxID=135735 RepID=UPI00124D2B8E|nr:endonuclease/exonuclease/phosphatase family protein [Priestia endophytica]KAB2495580.1 endonuclease [Priestia endophytica]